ncbi:hypothetical protein Vafri_3913 [Volvox africanus]|uniref:Uncharacterized protein n=1 Tax=Volvox africanus TaxID=51714 RepID=A0A8J4ETY5_9CHLO|nr:hypothetical protein Vafri_3913 [Volvox africanus]
MLRVRWHPPPSLSPPPAVRCLVYSSSPSPLPLPFPHPNRPYNRPRGVNPDHSACLRCLQTAATACRRLGVRQLHVSWAVSEALCRISDIPTGPLPHWMWPRVVGNPKLKPLTDNTNNDGGDDGDDGNDGDDGSCSNNEMGALTAEEFLTELGAVVVAADEEAASVAGELQPVRDPCGGRVRRGSRGGEEEHNTKDAGMGEGRGQQHSMDAHGQVLKGLAVTVLPPPGDPSASPPSGDRDVPTRPETASALDGDETACDVMPLAGEGGEGGCAAGRAISDDPKTLSCGPPGARRDEAAHGQGYDTGPSDMCLVGPQQCEHFAHDQHQGGETSFDRDEHPAVQVAVQMYSVPHSPESPEAAHVRYRAVLRCLMATAAATADAVTTHASDAGRIQFSPGKVDTGPACTASLGRAGQKELRTWQALWRGGTLLSVDEAADAAPMDDRVGGSGSSPRTGCRAVKTPTSGIRESDDDGGAQSPGPAATPGGSEATLEALPMITATGHHGDNTTSGVTCCRGDLGNGDEDSPQEPLERSVNQLDSAPHRHTPPTRRQRCLEQQQQQQQQHAAEAVLVITHGEAVACAATTVAPFTLVYEVRHTGFVVLASTWNTEGGEQPAGGGDGCGKQGAADGSSDALWELVPDPDGDRGVLWMSVVND